MKVILLYFQLNIDFALRPDIHPDGRCHFILLIAFVLEHCEWYFLGDIGQVLFHQNSGFDQVSHFAADSVETLVLFIEVVELELESSLLLESARRHQLLGQFVESGR